MVAVPLSTQCSAQSNLRGENLQRLGRYQPDGYGPAALKLRMHAGMVTLLHSCVPTLMQCT